ncbi:hypothetical protein [Thermomonospora cellulosilytica]|uniref:Uncharacterized protein n=1 Tax=Thermomonospora cellulosilytica TaxID=1411118 RepID=A0A7W3MUD6_9ACTN|nr:hypothetical protein [Thermomonospora cellulosilytica]MBA9001987.1 hypothetical protein [Thermomonospora cellulosilytica]
MPSAADPGPGDQAIAALARVAELHTPALIAHATQHATGAVGLVFGCAHCNTLGQQLGEQAAHFVAWPCPTLTVAFPDVFGSTGPS